MSLVEEKTPAEPSAVPPPARQSGATKALAERVQAGLPRLYDALVVLWLSVFHHVLGVKYRFAQIAYDEHYFLFEGWSVLKGQIPYRDFQEFKPPVIFFVHALGIKLFGLEGLGYRKFLALLSLASFLAVTVALLSRRVSRVLVIGVMMLLINHFYDDALHNAVINDAETLALDFFLLGTGVLLTPTRWERTRLVLGGALLALSPLSKEPMVPPVGAAWLCVGLLHYQERPSKETIKRFALLTTAGVLGVATTWLLYMLLTGSLSWYLLQLKLNLAYTANYAYQLGWASRTPAGGAFAATVRQLSRVYLNATHLTPLLPLLLALVTLGDRSRKLVGLAALATFAAALYAVSVGHGFAPRYFIMAMAGTFLCAALGASVLDQQVARASRELRDWVAASFLGLALLVTGPRLSAEWKAYAKYKPEPIPVEQSDIDLVRRHTGPDDKIWTTDDPLLYVFSDRESAFRGGIVLDEIIGYYPGETDEERLSVVRQGLEENRPKLVIFGDNQVGPHRKQRYMQALVLPFLRDHGYRPLNERFFIRPD